ncbi:hypothetical protein ACDI16_15780 [Oceanobacillus caeni]
MRKTLSLMISFALLMGLAISPAVTQAETLEGDDVIILTPEEQEVADQIQSELEFIFAQRDPETGLFVIDQQRLSQLYPEEEDRNKVIELMNLFNEYEKTKVNNDGMSTMAMSPAVEDCLVKSVAAILGVPASYTLAGKTLNWYIKTYDWKALAEILAKNTTLKTTVKRALLPVTLFGTWLTCGAIKAS